MDLLLHPDTQTIRANLELYTDGDAGFEKELLMLMMGDLQDLRDSYDRALNSNNPDIFCKAVHKAKVTLDILCCEGLDSASNNLQLHWQKGEFENFCDKLSAVLRTELGISA